MKFFKYPISLIALLALVLIACEEQEKEELNEPTPTWECVSGNCIPSSSGTFLSQSDCNANCSSGSNNGPLYTKGGGMVDFEGNTYETVIINGREWMAENLRMRNAPPVNGPDLVFSDDYQNWTSGTNNGIRAYCYPGDDINNFSEYGVLYTWYAVRYIDLCPNGWHIPTADEWWDMMESLDPDEYAYRNASDELRSVNGWPVPGNNRSGMNIKPAGSTLGAVPLRPQYVGDYAGFWTSTETNTTNADYINFWSTGGNGGLIKSYRTSGTHRPKYNAAACRCIKDE